MKNDQIKATTSGVHVEAGQSSRYFRAEVARGGIRLDTMAEILAAATNALHTDDTDPMLATVRIGTYVSFDSRGAPVRSVYVSAPIKEPNRS